MEDKSEKYLVESRLKAVAVSKPASAAVFGVMKLNSGECEPEWGRRGLNWEVPRQPGGQDEFRLIRNRWMVPGSNAGSGQRK